MSDIKIFPEFNEWQEEFTVLRHEIHKNPELGFGEKATSEIVAKRLVEWGYEVTRNVGETGVVGQLKVGNGTRTIGLRADLDALPILEETKLEYASHNEGKMHACGHDGHTVTLLAAARYLAKTKNFSGTLNLIFQPAEEGLGGASRMIKDDLFTRFPCDAVYAWHNMPNFKDDCIYIKSGAVMASSDRFTITIKGRGSHAACPESSRDPIVAGAAIVTALQTIVSRNVPSEERVVVSIGAFMSGNKTSYNVIQDEAKILLSVRTLDPEIRKMVLQRIEDIVNAQAKSFGVEADIHLWNVSLTTMNSEAEAKFAQKIALEMFGEEHCNFNFESMMTSEDFAFMLEEKPGCYILMSNGEGSFLHNPKYNFNDKLIPIMGSYLSRVVMSYLTE